MKTLKELREEFAKAQTDANALVSKAEAENRELTAEEKTENENRFTRVKVLKGVIEEREKFEALQLGDEPPVDDKTKVETPKEPPGKKEYRESEGHETKVDPADDPFHLDDAGKRKFSREVNAYGISGELGPIAKRFATITTATNSGILLPKTVMPPTLPMSANAFRTAMGVVGVKPMETSGTEKITLTVLDASAGGVVAETASSETENAPSTTESINLTPQTFQSGSVWFSNMALAAVGFDLLNSVLPDLTYSKELGLESAIAAAMIADSGITQSVATATTTGFTYANLVDLNRKLPSRYDSMKAIVLGRDAYSAAEKLVGSDGHPVLIMDPQNQWLMRFNGTPVVRSDYLEAFGATKVVGLIVSFLGWKLRDVTVQNLARYVNQPARPNQTGLNLFAYHAYGYSVSACAKLTTPAS